MHISVLPIVTGADTPVLRAEAEPIKKVTKSILKLIKDMERTMVDAEGVGLAAPQIGQSIQLCLVTVNQKVLPLINPEILWVSEEESTMEEGCLSLPGVEVKVSRPIEIGLRFTDTKGKTKELHLKDFNARVVQHELDHLHGVLIVDY